VGIFIAIVFSVLSAFCYRVGGMSKEQAEKYFPWFPQVLVRSWFRDAGCVILTLIWTLLFVKVAWYWYIPAAGAMYGAMTTYWDDKIPPKNVDKFWAHGLFIGLAWMFIAIPAGVWVGGLIRLAIMATFMGVWCYIFSNDFVEEFGRGAIITATLPFLLVNI